jgi:hypothetical protein
MYARDSRSSRLDDSTGRRTSETAVREIKGARTDTEVRVDGGEQRRSHTVEIVLLVRDVRGRARVAEFFGEPKVDDVDHVCGFSGAHDKVGRLDVTVHDRVGMDEFDARYLMK